MRLGTLGYWGLVAVTLGFYLAILTWSLPFIRQEAGGLSPFDISPAGYSYEQARAFLSALSPEGLARYRGAQSHLDAIYPALLFAVFAIGMWHLSEGLWKIVPIALIAVAVIGMFADTMENSAVRALLDAGPEAITPEMVAQASFLTVLKSASNTICYLAMFILLLRWWWRGKRNGGDIT